MFLGGVEIERALSTGLWNMQIGEEVCAPAYWASLINPNSIDITLHRNIFKVLSPHTFIDPSDPDTFITEPIESPCILEPGFLYLAAARERINCNPQLDDREWFPCVEGKSTLGRIGMSIHETAGWGDYGFNGAFTLEISVKYPTKVYENMPIAQIAFSDVLNPKFYEGHYTDQDDGPKLPVLGERFAPS